MKKLLILVSVSLYIFSACNSSKTSETKTNDITVSDSTSKYACPMDPEIKGKKGDKCSKCGMELTALSVQKENEHDHQAKADSIQ